MSKTVKRIGIGFGIGLIVFGSILIGILYYVETDSAQHTLKTKINEKIPGTLSWDGFRYSLVSGTFELTNGSILDPQAAEVIHFDRLYVDILSSDLFKGTVTVNSLILDRPIVRIHIDPDGNLNLLNLFPQPQTDQEKTPQEPSKGIPFNIIVQDFRIQNGEVHFEDFATESKPIKASVNGIDLSVQGNLAQQTASLDLKIAGGNIESPELKTRMDRFELKTRFAAGKLDPIHLKIGTPAVKMTTSGSIENLTEGQPLADLKVGLKASLDELKTMLGLDLSGTVVAAIELSGTQKAPHISCSINYSGGSVTGIPIELAEFDFDFKERIFRLDKLHVDAAPGTIGLNGKIDLTHAISEDLKLPSDMMQAISQILLDMKYDLSLSLPEIKKIAAIQPTLTGNVKLQGNLSGQPNDPELICRMTYDGGILADQRIDAAQIRLNLKDRLVNIEECQINLASGQTNLAGRIQLKEAFPEGFLKSSPQIEQIAYDIAMNLKDIQIQKLIPDSKLVGGTIHSDLTVKGIGVSPETLASDLRLNLTVNRLSANQVAKPVDIRLETQGQLKAGQVSVNPFIARVGEIDLQAKANYHLVSQELDADVTLNAPELAASLAPLGVPDIAGSLNLKSRITGKVKTPKLDLSVNGKKLAFQDIRIGDVAIAANIDNDGKLHIKELSLDNQGSEIRGSGFVQVFNESFAIDSNFPLNLNLTMKHIETRDFLAKEVASGTLEGKIHLDGSIHDLKGDISLQGKNIAVESNRIGDLDVRMRLADGEVFLDHADIRNKRSAINIHGKAKVFDTAAKKPLSAPIIQASIKADPLFIEDFMASPKGRVKIIADIRGTPEALTGSASIEASNIDLDVQKIQKVQLNAQLKPGKVDIDSILVLLSPGESITGKGWIGFDKTFQINIASQGISLDSIEQVRKQQAASGKIVLDVSGNGTFDNPALTGKVNLTNLKLLDKPFDDFDIRFQLRDHLAEFTGKLNFGVNGSLDLKKKDFQATATFTDTDLTPYFRLANQPDLSGSIHGIIKASGNIQTPDQIVGSMDISSLVLLMKGTELIATHNLKANFDSGNLTLPGCELTLLKEGKLMLAGSAGIKSPLDLKVKGDIPVRVAGVFVEELSKISGKIGLSVSIKGESAKPDILADIQLINIEMTVPELMQKLSIPNGIIRATTDSIKIETLSGTLDAGKFDITGTVDLKNFQPSKMSVKLKMNGLPISVPDSLDVVLNSDLALQGTPEKSLLRGEIVLVEGTYHKDVDLGFLILDKVGKKSRTESSSPAKPANPFLKNMELDIAIKYRNPFSVENNLAMLEIKPDLRIKGNASQPIVDGRASIDNGTIFYQKQSFTVKKGVIDFINPYKIEPSLDIESQFDIRKWAIFLNISGTSADLKFKLSSNPSEEDGDIISLLLFGKTTKELIDGEGGASQSPTQLLTKMIADTLQDDIQKTTGLDIFQVESGRSDSGTESSDRVKVTLGKNITKRLSVKYNVESGQGELVQRAIAEYKFLENLLLSGFQDNRGIFGGELKYRLEFR